MLMILSGLPYEHCHTANRFNAEFIEWRKSKLEDCDGDVNRLIQYICQLMYDVFHTQDSALDDLLSPIDKNEIEEK